MKRFYKTFRLNESGVSLVEVIASIVILSIIILSTYTLITQSAKTTKNSEQLIDATYVAQQEMEKLYLLTQQPLPSGADPIHQLLDQQYYQGQPYTIEKDSTGKDVYKSLNDDGTYEITLSIYPHNEPTIGNSTLYIAIIRVYEINQDRLKAQMESTLEWSP